ncbi:MAG TPA: hypothetical protein VEK34_12030 [Methylocella sp.]|nr:hypothetical protein [Methylocella sp.]
MVWANVKRVLDILKDKIGQFWDFLIGPNGSNFRLVPARAARRQSKSRVPRANPVASPLDPNRFQLD